MNNGGRSGMTVNAAGHAARWCRALVSGLVLLACAGQAASVELRFVTEEQPPLNAVQPDGSVGGLSTAVIREMLRRARLAGSFSILPWSRAFLQARQQPDTCLYSTVRSAEREPLFAWVGPISANQWILYAGPLFRGHIETLDDARPYRIGGTLRDAKSDFLRAKGFTRLELATDEEHNIRMLMAGHLDLWLAAMGRAQTLIERFHARGVRPVLVLNRLDQYVACHPGTDRAALAALEAALASMRRDGTLRMLTGRFAPGE